MKRTLAIGDIHGGLRALHQVLERAKVCADDTLIFLGDYVDGWSESAAVIDFLRQRRSVQPCVFLKGNHDQWCEEWLQTGQADKNWLAHGGQSTIKSYAAMDDDSIAAQLAFFAEMKLYVEDNSGRLFVHAGFTSPGGPAQEPLAANLSWDRTLWEAALETEETGNGHLPKQLGRMALYKEIYIGHTPTIYFNVQVPMRACNVWNLDTGAAFTGKLTIMDIDTKEFWQSDQLKKLYPKESGRNR
ncbi:MAG TPA: metallophosphoesterase [Chitinophagaceae bacterium]|nr:metallophosphoesterase [Chitinophagaceae bacterium]